jgi:hypothetical protein
MAVADAVMPRFKLSSFLLAIDLLRLECWQLLHKGILVVVCC